MAFIGLCCKEWNKQNVFKKMFHFWLQTYFKKCLLTGLFPGSYQSSCLNWSQCGKEISFLNEWKILSGLYSYSSISTKISKIEAARSGNTFVIALRMLICSASSISEYESEYYLLLSIFNVKWQWIEINQVTDVQKLHFFIVFPH